MQQLVMHALEYFLLYSTTAEYYLLITYNSTLYIAPDYCAKLETKIDDGLICAKELSGKVAVLPKSD